MPEQQPAAVPPKKGVEPPLLPNFLNYQVAGQIRSDHRETLRGSGTPTLTEGFSGIRNRDVFILNDGTDATADGALQIP
jgi:hypothetical protein